MIYLPETEAIEKLKPEDLEMMIGENSETVI